MKVVFSRLWWEVELVEELGEGEVGGGWKAGDERAEGFESEEVEIGIDRGGFFPGSVEGLGGPRHAPDGLAFVIVGGAVFGDFVGEDLGPLGGVSVVDEIRQGLHDGRGEVGFRADGEPEFEMGKREGAEEGLERVWKVFLREFECGGEIGFGDGVRVEFVLVEVGGHHGGLMGDTFE